MRRSLDIALNLEGERIHGIGSGLIMRDLQGVSLNDDHVVKARHARWHRALIKEFRDGDRHSILRASILGRSRYAGVRVLPRV